MTAPPPQLEARVDLLLAAADYLAAHARDLPHDPWGWRPLDNGYPQRITNPAAILIAEIYEAPAHPAELAPWLTAFDPAAGRHLAATFRAAASNAGRCCQLDCDEHAALLTLAAHLRRDSRSTRPRRAPRPAPRNTTGEPHA